MNVSKLIPFHIITIVTALFIASSNATSQASLTLQGEILPSSCDITMDSSGKVQLGKMNTPNFSSETKSIRLPERNIIVSINCPAATLFGIRPMDIAINAGNVKHDGSGDNTVFSLGLTASGQAIGGYYASINKSLSSVDGKQPDNIIASRDQGNSWNLAQGNLSAKGENVYSWGEQTQPHSARSVKVSLIITPFLFKNNYSDTVNIEGLSSFELVYL